MQLSFIEKTALLEYADPKSTSNINDKQNKDVKKFFTTAYKALDKTLKANNLTLKVNTNDFKTLSIQPNGFVGQIILEHNAKEPRVKDLFTVVPYGIHGSKSINDRLSDGEVLNLSELQGAKGLQIVETVVDKLITSGKFLNESMLVEAENDIYSTTEKQKEAEEAENDDSKTASNNKKIDYLKEAEKAIRDNLKKLKIEQRNGFKIEATTKNNRLSITLTSPRVVDLIVDYNTETFQVFVNKVVTTLGDNVDLNNINIIKVLKKLNEKLGLNPPFTNTEYFAGGDYKSDSDEASDVDSSNTDKPNGSDNNTETIDSDSEDKKDTESSDESDDAKQDDLDIKAKNQYQESLIEILLQNTVQENKQPLLDALSKNNFTEAVKLLKDENGKALLIETDIRVAFSRLILFNLCDVTKPDLFDDMRCLEFFSCIEGFKATINLNNNQNLYIINRYIKSNQKARFTAASSDSYLFKFLSDKPQDIDRFETLAHFNPKVSSVFFDNKNPKPIGNKISALFYCRDFFKTYKNNAELFYNIWLNFNPNANTIEKFKKALLQRDNREAAAFRKQVNLPNDGQKVSSRAKELINGSITVKDKDGNETARPKNNLEMLQAIKQLIFTVDGEGEVFRSNISEIQKTINAFKNMCNSQGGNTSKQSTSDEDSSSSNVNTDYADLLNTLLAADKKDQVHQDLSKVATQINKRLKAAQSNSNLQDELKAIQKAFITILKNSDNE